MLKCHVYQHPQALKRVQAGYLVDSAPSFQVDLVASIIVIGSSRCRHVDLIRRAHSQIRESELEK